MQRILCLRSLVCLLLAAVGCLGAVEAAAQQSGPPIRDPRRTVQRHVYSWQALKERNVVMQGRDYSCGAAALATLIRYYWGDDVGEADVLEAILASLSQEQLKDRVENGLSMTDLRKAAVAGGYQATMGRRSLAQMAELRVPVIVRIEKNDYEHFVVFRGLANDRVFLADPIRGNVRVSFSEFARQWPDRAILVVAKPGADLPTDAPLLLRQHGPVQPELQTVRRALVLTP